MEYLKKQDYKVLYENFHIDITPYGAKCITITILPQNKTIDFINELDLVVDNINNIKQIDILIGGQRIDKFNSNDIVTQIKINCILSNRFINFTRSGKVIIPLPSKPLLYVNDIKQLIQVSVTFFSDNIPDCQIWGNKYYLANKINPNYDIVINQNQYCGQETLKKGVNKFKLYFDGPVQLIYFWGMDVDKITEIEITLDNNTFFKGDVDILETKKRRSGHVHIKPLIYYFAGSEINHSKFDFELIITTKQEETVDIDIVAISLLEVQYSDGMFKTIEKI